MSIELKYCPHCNSQHADCYRYCKAPASEQPDEIADICKRLNNLAWECRHGEPISRDAIGTLCADAEKALKRESGAIEIGLATEIKNVLVALIAIAAGTNNQWTVSTAKDCLRKLIKQIEGGKS